MATSARSGISTTTAPTISKGATLAALAETTTVFCDSVALRIAPHFSTAQFSHKYGKMSFAPGAKFKTEASLNLAGQYVQVALGEDTIFTGIIIPQVNQPLGTFADSATSVPTGNNIYTAYGLDFLLDRVFINKSVTKNHSTVKTIFEFNGSQGTFLQKNRTAVKSGDCHIFDYSGTGENWTGLDILEYLLANFAAETGLSWTLSSTGKHAYLANIVASFDPNGKTVRQIINEIISPSNGFSWKTVIKDGAPQIHVFPIVDVEIKEGETIIVPASAETARVNSGIESSRAANNVQISQVEQSAYDYIRITSEPVRVMATYKLGDADDGLEKDWTDALATQYGSADEEDRSDDQYEKLFAGFKIGNGWTGFDYQGNPVIPVVKESDLTVTFSESNPFCWPAHVFDRSLPLRKDLSDDTSDYRVPALYVWDTDKSEYFIANKLARTGKSEAADVGLSMTDDAPGILLNPAWQHMLASADFSGTSDFAALYDYADCLFTGSFYTDATLAYKISGVTTSGPDRTKNIHIPGLHYWVAMNGTRIGQKSTLPSQMTIRDDRETIKKIAKLAAAWYGRIRNTVSFTYEYIYAADYLGYMITSIYTGGNFTAAGTIMSSIDYDFVSNRISFATDFQDVDFSRISRRSLQISQKATATRLARLEEKTRNLPVRQGGATGGGSAVKWAVITAVTDANNYTCSIWTSRGSHTNGDAAAETSKQVRVPDIVDSLVIDDSFPVVASAISGEDYECIQQMGAVG